MIDFDFNALQTIGLTQASIGQLSNFRALPDGTRLLRVSEVHRDLLTVHDGSVQWRARAMPQLWQAVQALATGDWVLAAPDAHGDWWIHARLDPASEIARRTSDGTRQALANNVDTALLVMGLDLDFNLRRMERYVAMAQTAGVAAVAVLTKADSAADVEERMAQLRKRLPPSVAAVAVNGHDRQAAAELAPWLGAGQTLILLGSSGAGKSTLTNTLTASAQETGRVREGDGRGRHTTTARSLHQCPGGACIIDTPGLRTWTPDADEASLAASFEDIEALSLQCQFRDCGHQGEPGCAVQAGVDADRLANYHKLLREVRRSQQTPLDRIAERGRWKVIVRSVQAHNKRKRDARD